MCKLEIELEHCYGIKKFTGEFFSEENVELLYAPNGTMKTSLTKTLEDVSAKKETHPCDLINPNNITKCKVTFGQYGYILENNHIENFNPIPNIRVFKSRAEKFSDGMLSANIQNLLADNEHKKKLGENIKDIENIFKEIHDKVDLVIKELRKNDKQIPTMNDFFKGLSLDNLLDLKKPKQFKEYEKIIDILLNKKNTMQIEEEYYSMIIPENLMQVFTDNKAEIEEYIITAENIAKADDYFSSEFSLKEIDKIKTGLDKGNFFLRHKAITKNDQREFDSIDEYNEYVEQKSNLVFQNKNLRQKFDVLASAFGKKKNDGYLNKVKNNMNLLSLIIESGAPIFNLNILQGICADELENLSTAYSNYKKNKEKIIETARKDKQLWEEVVTEFNQRFHLPYQIEIINKEDALLNDEIPELQFFSINKDTDTVVDPKSIGETVSQGEERAYFLLNILLQIHSLEQQQAVTNNEKFLLVFDDIVDSFDYKNKYAIIEYLYDISIKQDCFKMLILTHNFDFFKTVSSRLNCNSQFCFKSTDGKIEITNNLEKNILKGYMKVYKAKATEKNGAPKYEHKRLIAMVPFIRNIAEYLGYSTEFKDLTSCLHIKPQNLKIDEIYKHINTVASISQSNIQKCNIDFIDVLFDEANNCIENPCSNDELLTDKVILAIACRLLLEKIIIHELGVNKIKMDNIKKNQTRELIKEITPDKEELKKLGNRVSIITPETIHLNSFMIEPILDLSKDEFVHLYKDLIIYLKKILKIPSEEEIIKIADFQTGYSKKLGLQNQLLSFKENDKIYVLPRILQKDVKLTVSMSFDSINEIEAIEFGKYPTL